ncbi:hypothetical protein [Acinetobacter silvestris]|uniref:Uncharacterized protein n=1 Tax=Acinetobacter silvestris TaxID=1977882 RepID=A0A1Y3CEA7_9GAMM|nr:hypothetical protein [Acinetobacter silvestris]OTG65429.1 hypothetical protein B9T28_08140 [Acinetobacter silvestris]
MNHSKVDVAVLTISGDVDNNLDEPSNHNQPTYQFSVFSTNESEALIIAEKVRRAIKRDCYVTRPPDLDQDPNTGIYQVTFDTSWHIGW